MPSFGKKNRGQKLYVLGANWDYQVAESQHFQITIATLKLTN